jgi:hypothetical protein
MKREAPFKILSLCNLAIASTRQEKRNMKPHVRLQRRARVATTCGLMNRRLGLQNLASFADRSCQDILLSVSELLSIILKDAVLQISMQNFTTFTSFFQVDNV